DDERYGDAGEIVAAEREGEEIGCECADRDHVRVGEVDLHQNPVDERESQCDQDIEASEDYTVDCLLQGNGQHRPLNSRRAPSMTGPAGSPCSGWCPSLCSYWTCRSRRSRSR